MGGDGPRSSNGTLLIPKVPGRAEAMQILQSLPLTERNRWLPIAEWDDSGRYITSLYWTVYSVRFQFRSMNGTFLRGCSLDGE
jgi:hypothetical protein